MAVRTLQQILSELNRATNPQVASLRQRQSLIPQQIASEEQGLQAKQTQAFGDILSGFRQRGLGFSGIPGAEQAKYTSTEFLPALARLRQTGQENARSLEDAILGIRAQNMQSAQGLRQADLDRAQQWRIAKLQDAAARRAAAAANAVPSLGGVLDGLFGGGGNQKQPSATAKQRKDKGFNFTDANGKPISAAQYAAATGQNFRALLKTLAEAGDRGAKLALGFVGNDYKYDPSKINSSQRAKLYNALTWGVKDLPRARYTAPVPRYGRYGMYTNPQGTQRYNFLGNR